MCTRLRKYQGQNVVICGMDGMGGQKYERKSLKAKKGVEVLCKMSVVFKTCTYPHPQTGVCT